jgi:hypothetical protein
MKMPNVNMDELLGVLKAALREQTAALFGENPSHTNPDRLVVGELFVAKGWPIGVGKGAMLIHIELNALGPDHVDCALSVGRGPSIQHPTYWISDGAGDDSTEVALTENGKAELQSWITGRLSHYAALYQDLRTSSP